MTFNTNIAIDPFTALKFETLSEDFRTLKTTFGEKLSELTSVQAEMAQLKHKFEILKDIRSDILEVKGSNSLFKNSIEKVNSYTSSFDTLF